MALTDARHIPSSTYRTQMNAGFTFPMLEELAPYLRSLGVGDCYLSPILFSPPGSTHGYDVSDYRRIDPELGGEAAFDRLAEKLRGAGLGLLVDFVPNHMGIRGPFNPWWLDVLEFGRRSAYAHFFDIHWKHGDRERDDGRILLPVLDNHYGVVLENGGLRLKCENGGLRVHFGDAYFPLRPASAAAVLEDLAADAGCPVNARTPLRSLAAEFRSGDGPEISAAKERLASLLKTDPAARTLMEAALRKLNGEPGRPASFDALDRMLDGQHYRLAHWKTGVFAANYRRFFAVDSLIGVRVEEADVFAETHALAGRLLRQGKITGLRIDHIDGLWDPQQYLERLQGLGAPAAGATYVIVEKILAGSEALPLSWPAHGTTGYEFIAQCGRLFVPAANEAEFTGIYAAFAGPTPSFEEVAYEKKRLVLSEMFANTILLLADRLAGILDADRRQRDLTHRELVVAIRETMAGMGIYRTYRRPEGGITGQDAEAMETACGRAIRQNPGFDREVLRLIRDIVTGAYPPAAAPEELRRRLTRWVMGFQQYTGAIMAKALEDTAFYIYNRLIALNEVGGDPGAFGGSIGDFHSANLRRREQTPHALLATSTHDTKMSEDLRARLYALAEIPGEWEEWIREWREMNQPLKSTVDGRAVPDPNEEYRLYQVLLGVWPLAGAEVDDGFRARLREHMRKAENEARRNTTWIQPNEDWLKAGDRFIDAILAEPAGDPFRKSFGPKADRLAHLGMVNSLAQLVLKAASPGVPDFYQGNETWEFRLVDPDNRQPVDFARRRKLLEAIGGRRPAELLENWRDGGIKLFVTRALLHLRRERTDIFARGDYVPLTVRGRGADQVVAFLRGRGQAGILVAVPRHSASLGCPPLGSAWGDTTVCLPAPAALLRDRLTGRLLAAGAEIPVAELLAELPVAVVEIGR